MSLPSWERGLKSSDCVSIHSEVDVAPLVGARVEIYGVFYSYDWATVAPLVGARVEIVKIVETAAPFDVAPLVGARVEMDLLW